MRLADGNQIPKSWFELKSLDVLGKDTEWFLRVLRPHYVAAAFVVGCAGNVLRYTSKVISSPGSSPGSQETKRAITPYSRMVFRVFMGKKFRMTKSTK
jgi:hypothetical protein